ncbi:MAG: Trm112 family protein [Candidatus Aenigmarchaeota archaeon]|nr:Trm112 family protein [Candidatus Aenigmarchaeota archaeon]
MAISEHLKNVLACPKCKGNVKEENMFITCSRCGLAYPVLDGNVPDMLIEDTWKLDKARKAGFVHTDKL